MPQKIKKSKFDSLHPPKNINREEKVRTAIKAISDMKEKLVAEGLEKSLPMDLARSFDIGDEGDRADTERTHEVSILLSVRDKEKLHAAEEALERIRGGTYGICEECGDEIGGERLKVMPLAKSCVTCQSQMEKEKIHQRFAEEEPDQSLIGEIAEAGTD
ncbi:MAG: zinc finger transcriptional regulator, TraR/DksA family [Deltaproteobacteria bacterium]|jgi:DnaK suppressor protein|nr:zinc finger transcriptional regulator, TraR/DksA family [Deltaproteobacteria bacterium]